MDKDAIMDALEDEREKFMDAIDGLTEAQMTEPGVSGDWSVKDIIYHLSMWEAELVRLLWQAAHNEKPTAAQVIGGPVDATNAAWHAQGKDRPLERALDDFIGVRKQTVRRVEALPEKDFEDPGRYPWLNDRPLWEWIASDSFEHESEHAEQIRQWRAGKGY